MIFIILAIVLITGYYMCAEIYYERDFPRSTWKGFAIALMFLMAGISAFGQTGNGVRWDYTATTIAGNPPYGSYPPLLAIPGVPVSTTAQTYTDATLTTACPRNTPIVPNGTTTCTALTDAQGNFGWWVASGTYTYTINFRGSSYGPYSFTAGGTGSGGGGTPIPNPTVVFFNQMTVQLTGYNFTTNTFLQDCYDAVGRWIEPDTFNAPMSGGLYIPTWKFATPQSGSCVASNVSGGGVGGQYLPLSGGTVTGSLYAQQDNGVYNANLFTGSTVAAQVQAVGTACGSNGCISLLPAGMAAGALPTITGTTLNQLIDDERFLNSQGPNYGQLSYTHAFDELSENIGNFQSWELPSPCNSAQPSSVWPACQDTGPTILSMTANVTGGDTTPAYSTQGEVIPFVININRSDANSKRFTEGQDISMTYAGLGNQSVNLELDMGTATSGINAVPSQSTMLQMITYGASRVGAGIVLSGTQCSTTLSCGFNIGLDVNNYLQGLTLTSGNTASINDILVQAPDTSPTRFAIKLTNSAAPGGAFVVTDAGSINANGLYSANPVAATSGSNMNSPPIVMEGPYWNGTASVYDGWQMVDVVGTGTNPTSTFQFSHIGSSTGTATVAFTTGVQFTTATQGAALCVNSAQMLSHCTSAVGSGGTCTCP